MIEHNDPGSELLVLLVVFSLVFAWIYYKDSSGTETSQAPVTKQADESFLAQNLDHEARVLDGDSSRQPAATKDLAAEQAHSAVSRPLRVLVKFESNRVKSPVREELNLLGGSVIDVIEEIGIIVASFDNYHFLNLKEDVEGISGVKYVELDVELDPSEIPTLQEPEIRIAEKKGWHLLRLGLPTAWEVLLKNSKSLPDIKIAHIDTGVNVEHEDLRERVLEGWNLLDGTSNVSDEHGHGTATAGVMVAAVNNKKGIAGVALNNVKLLPIKVAGETGKARLSDILKGILWASQKDARIIYVAYSVHQSKAVADAARLLKYETNSVLVVPAGNDSKRYKKMPSAENILVIGATDLEDERASWSSFGFVLDAVAPGELIWTTSHEGSYKWRQGTSFSAGIFAATLALALSVSPSRSPYELFHQELRHECNDLATTGIDHQTGAGILNALKVVLSQKPDAGYQRKGTLEIEPCGSEITNGDDKNFHSEASPQKSATRLELCLKVLHPQYFYRVQIYQGEKKIFDELITEKDILVRQLSLDPSSEDFDLAARIIYATGETYNMSFNFFDPEIHDEESFHLEENLIF